MTDKPKRGPGRPPKPAGEGRDSTIVWRLKGARKAAYVRAAQPGTLVSWLMRHLDAAAGYSESAYRVWISGQPQTSERITVYSSECRLPLRAEEVAKQKFLATHPDLTIHDVSAEPIYDVE